MVALIGVACSDAPAENGNAGNTNGAAADLDHVLHAPVIDGARQQLIDDPVPRRQQPFERRPAERTADRHRQSEHLEQETSLSRRELGDGIYRSVPTRALV
jgi:hypothetical protein